MLGADPQYGQFGGTEILPVSYEWQRVMVSAKLKDLVENYAVPYFEALVGGKVGERVYVEDMNRSVLARPEELFLACMMVSSIFPPNRCDRQYLKCAYLVEAIRSKNGFTEWAWQYPEISAQMPETLLFHADERPKSIPFFKNFWVKFSKERRGGAVKPIRGSSEADAMRLLEAFLAANPRQEYQIQRGVEEGHIVSPHVWIHAEHDKEVEFELISMSESLFDANAHHVGSKFGGESTQKYAWLERDYVLPLCRQLAADGYFGFVNPDYIVSTTEVKVLENNARPGGCTGPGLLLIRLGREADDCSYIREVPRNVPVSKVYRIAEREEVIPYLVGYMLDEYPRVGLMAIGKDCDERLARAATAISG
jgi:hypothetical protein